MYKTFHQACKDNNINRVLEMLDIDPTIIYISDDSGNTAAHICALCGSYDILFFFITNYPNILSYKDNDNKSIAHILENNPPILAKLLNIYPKEYLNELDSIKFDHKTLLLDMIKQKKRYSDTKINS
ncbi:MAG: ankyrin repeat domain-containing protein [Harvfovirus sp.]|uniref:Ankyrin repeat domain-containing protein n=1 Tax=Harvfovirus sp. TaxID=2487768 RepID=A0A3G5A445_9VIRU|nr:MAG: ankyrin repeat domain-containing protein [Harvfovirus sp.]